MRRIALALLTAGVISGGFAVLAASPAAADKIWSTPDCPDTVQVSNRGR